MRIGIDLGGTKIEGIVMDGDGLIVYKQRLATPSNDYRATLTAIRQLVDNLEAQASTVCSIGIGTPGSLSHSGLMRNSNSTCLNGQPLQTDLEALLKRKIRIANDADCFALSEAVDGAGKQANTVFGVILGTGVGSGIVVNGRLLQGINGVAGEWGHNPMPNIEGETARQCYCGKTNCVETWLSGPALSYDHMLDTGEELTAIDIASKAEQGGQSCIVSLERYERRLAQALSTVINIIDPDVIILGGGIGNIQRLYQTMPPLLKHWVFSDEVTTRIVPPSYGDSSGVRGAAWL